MPTFADNTAHLALGADGETRALRHLNALGFRLLARNWRPSGAARSLELDLVGMLDGFLLFVEVKSRRDSDLTEAGPLDNFTQAKRRKITRAAEAYLHEHARWNTPCRFDLICVTFFSGRQPELEHYAHVIEGIHIGNSSASRTVGRGHTAWQPW